MEEENRFIRDEVVEELERQLDEGVNLNNDAPCIQYERQLRINLRDRRIVEQYTGECEICFYFYFPVMPFGVNLHFHCERVCISCAIIIDFLETEYRAIHNNSAIRMDKTETINKVRDFIKVCHICLEDQYSVFDINNDYELPRVCNSCYNFLRSHLNDEGINGYFFDIKRSSYMNEQLMVATKRIEKIRQLMLDHEQPDIKVAQ